MRRLAVTALVLALIGGFAVLTGGSSGTGARPAGYWVELDNAFGLTPGSDFKIAGTRAGKISAMKLDQRTHKALIGLTPNTTSFTPLRVDTTCETRPQSLIGEYFIDCNPGRSPTKLKSGAVIPVTHTFSTIPGDLVQNVLRLPQRQRLRIILDELGIGLAARGQDVNSVVRRAVPALRETDRLLAVLANENQNLTQLTVNADTVISALAANRRQVTRFVREARDTSAATADRQVAFRETFRRLPAFLRELRPSLADLGQVADEQIPTLHDLDAASGNLKRFLDDLRPFSEASVPGITTLGQTAQVGRATIPPAARTVQRLNTFSRHTPELGKNLAIVLEDLFNRNRAVEKDPRSPGGQGFNGFEALLRYVFVQSQAVNIFDQNSYILKVALVLPKDCLPYRNADSVRGNEALQKECASANGPTQPAINAPDPSVGPREFSPERQQKQQQKAGILAAAQASAGPLPALGQPTAGTAVTNGAEGAPIDVGKSLSRLSPASAGSLGSSSRAASGAASNPDGSDLELLDYLLAP